MYALLFGTLSECMHYCLERTGSECMHYYLESTGSECVHYCLESTGSECMHISLWNVLDWMTHESMLATRESWLLSTKNGTLRQVYVVTQYDKSSTLCILAVRGASKYSFIRHVNVGMDDVKFVGVVIFGELPRGFIRFERGFHPIVVCSRRWTFKIHRCWIFRSPFLCLKCTTRTSMTCWAKMAARNVRWRAVPTVLYWEIIDR